jgi:preprotein translocase subunit SecA
LVEYKKEAFFLFENLLNKLKMDFVTILINLKIVQEPTQEEVSTKKNKINPKYNGEKISRNDPCPCGSGKKYKKCCGAL